jgi:hypothetical protein
MKIALLGSPRSGTTSLSNLIKLHLNKIEYKSFLEPFNPVLYNCLSTTDDLLPFSNLFIKTIYLSETKNYLTKAFTDNEDYLRWIVSFFDKVILLNRKDKIAQAESLIINEEYNRLYGFSWHQQKIYKTDDINEKLKSDIVDILNNSEVELKILSEKNGYPMFFYEDIYQSNNMNSLNEISKYLGLKFKDDLIMEWILNKNRRVRIDYMEKQKLI